MGKTNELWRDVTGLVWDVESMISSNQISEEKMMWLIPDGAMLDGEGRKRDLTGQLLSYLGVTDNPKFSEAEVETSEQQDEAPETIEVNEVTYYKTQPEKPSDNLLEEGKEWTLDETTSDKGVTYYAWIQTPITETPVDQGDPQNSNP